MADVYIYLSLVVIYLYEIIFGIGLFLPLGKLTTLRVVTNGTLFILFYIYIYIYIISIIK